MIEEMLPGPIGFDEFLKVDIRIGKVTSAELVPKSEKLIKLQVSFGDAIGFRTIVSGIAESFSDPDDLVDTYVLAIINLVPRKMMGIESHGMLLAADTDDGLPCLMRPEIDLTPGVRVA